MPQKTRKSNQPITKKGNWKPNFIAQLRKTRNFGQACQSVGISRAGAHAASKRDPDFKKAIDEAWLQTIDDLESCALKRAIEGWVEPVFQQGRLIGHVRKFSAGLTIFMLKCWKPEKYNIQDASNLETPADKARAVREALQAMGGTLDKEPKEG